MKYEIAFDNARLCIACIASALIHNHKLLVCFQDIDELSQQAASLVHEAWYSWHQALWHNRLAHTVPANGPLLLHGATRSRLAADVVSASATPILHHQAKALQLQLLVRHMARYALHVSVAPFCYILAMTETVAV